MVIFRVALFAAGALTVISVVMQTMHSKRRKMRGYWVSVHGGEWHVIYHEGSNSLGMDFELGGFGHPDILYVPTEEEWESSVPDWATNRRHEIMERVIAELGTKAWIYDGYLP